MGGSAIAGLIVKDLLPQMNIVVERNYVPNTSIDQDTFVLYLLIQVILKKRCLTIIVQKN